MPKVKSVGDVEQVAGVLLGEVTSHLRFPVLQDAQEGNDGVALVGPSGMSGSELGDCVLDVIQVVTRFDAQRGCHQVVAAAVGRADEEPTIRAGHRESGVEEQRSSR